MAVCCALRAARKAAVQHKLLDCRHILSASTCSLYTQTYAIRPPAESTAADLFGPASVNASLRSSTRAVAGRMFQQESVVLAEGTPTTLEGALQETDQARIVTEATPPFRITHANGPWEELCGWTADEVVNRAGLGFLQGPGTDCKAVERINAAVQDGGRIRVTVMNYTKDGTPFFNRLQVSPLRSPLGQVTHMLGVLTRADQL